MWAAVEVWLVVAQRFGFGAKMCISVAVGIVFSHNPEVENNVKFPLHMECLVLF